MKLRAIVLRNVDAIFWSFWVTFDVTNARTLIANTGNERETARKNSFQLSRSKNMLGQKCSTMR